MKKTSYFLILIIIVGVVLVSFWIYQKYIKTEGPSLLTFKVERGSLQEVVKVRGEVVAQKEYNLEFPFSEIIEKIFVNEGQGVDQGTPLMKLETTDFELELKALEAVLVQRQVNLSKLIAGPTTEDIKVSETAVLNAEVALGDAKNNLVDQLQDSYTKADDAIRNKTDQFFINPQTSSPQLSFSIADSQLENDIEWQRFLIENTFVSWKSALDKLTISSDLISYLNTANTNLNQIKSFLDKTALAVNNALTSQTVTQTNIDTWKTAASTARTSINTAINNLSTAEEKLKTAESNLLLAQKELEFKKAGTRAEDVEIARAQISETENQIAAAKEKIRKSTLYAPEHSRVVKIFLEEQELFVPGEMAIALAAGYKLQADISELEIGKIREADGNDVVIRLDAFPTLEFKGKVTSIEPKEIIKEGDKYYRTNIHLEKTGEEAIRTGMSADLAILISFKENVLKIPELAVYVKDDKKFVKVLEGKKQMEVEIETGISNGESIEITKGLNEGQIIVISAD